MLTIFMLVQMPGPRDILNLLARLPGIPAGHFLLCKSPGAGHTFRCKSPGVPGGVVTGQIDTCIKMSPRFVLGRENVPYVAEVVNRSLKADCTDFTLGLA